MNNLLDTNRRSRSNNVAERDLEHQAKRPESHRVPNTCHSMSVTQAL